MREKLKLLIHKDSSTDTIKLVSDIVSWEGGHLFCLILGRPNFYLVGRSKFKYIYIFGRVPKFLSGGPTITFLEGQGTTQNI